MPEMSKPQSIEEKQRPFRRAVLRGLGVVMPPLLTIVLFIWAWKTIESSVLEPIEGLTRAVIVYFVKDAHEELPPDATDIKKEDGQITSFTSSSVKKNRQYVRLGQEDLWVPREDYAVVQREPPVPESADQFYDRYVRISIMPRWRVIPFFLTGFVLVLYLLGKFLAAGMGRFLWNLVERVIHQLPIVRNVYSSVKQVTDFVFSEREIEFNRVVAVEYPRKGIWSIGFVTGESMLDIRSAANEPVLSVLMPTSPMPATGFTVTIRKSETIDLDLTIDQAIQFVVSCGVVVPPQQLHQNEIAMKITAAVEDHNRGQRDPSESNGQDEPSDAALQKEDPEGSS